VTAIVSTPRGTIFEPMLALAAVAALLTPAKAASASPAPHYSTSAASGLVAAREDWAREALWAAEKRYVDPALRRALACRLWLCLRMKIGTLSAIVRLNRVDRLLKGGNGREAERVVAPSSATWARHRAPEQDLTPWPAPERRAYLCFDAGAGEPTGRGW
jgi:hypothetical protein